MIVDRDVIAMILHGSDSGQKPFDALTLAHGKPPLKNCLAEPELAVVSFSHHMVVVAQW
jgi:hypothetical protein